MLITADDTGFYYENLRDGATLAAIDNGYRTAHYVTGRDGTIDELLTLAIQLNPDYIALAVPSAQIPTHYIGGLILLGVDISSNWIASHTYGEETTIGKRTGQLIANRVGLQKSILLVVDTPCYMRDDAWEMAFRNEMGIQGSHILARANCAGDAQLAYRRCKAVLESNPSISAVVCRTEEATLGALRAVRELELTIPIIGGEFNSEIALGLRDGQITFTVVRNAYAYGYIGVENALRRAQGLSAPDRRALDAVYVDATNMFDPEMQIFLFDV